MSFARRAAGGGKLGDRHAALHDLVYRELREAILAGRLKPGDRLVEDRIAADLGVSRNPVREAIRALSSQGLVEVASRRGAQVARRDSRDAREAVEVRALLEAHNARLAARHRNPQVLKRAAAVLEKGQAVLQSGQLASLVALNAQFHATLAEAGNNRLLGELLSTLRERSALFFAPDAPHRQERNWSEHAAILNAIIAGDESLAAELAMQHIMLAGEDRLATLAEQPSSDELPDREGKRGQGGKRQRQDAGGLARKPTSNRARKPVAEKERRQQPEAEQHVVQTEAADGAESGH